MKHLILISIFFFMLFVDTAEASDSLEQKSDNPFRFIIKAGWGGGTYGPNGNTGLVTGNYVIGIHKNNQILNLSVKLGSDIGVGTQVLTWGIVPKRVPYANINSFAINYGLQYQTGVLYLSGTVGAGYMKGL